MHNCPECGKRCYCDGKRYMDHAEAHFCVHCLPGQEKEQWERDPGKKRDEGEI